MTGGVRGGAGGAPHAVAAHYGAGPADQRRVTRSRSPIVDMGRVLDGLPDDLYEDWITGGLRMVEGCKPGGNIYRAALTEGRDLAAEVEQARAEHGRWLEENGFGDMVRRART